MNCIECECYNCLNQYECGECGRIYTLIKIWDKFYKDIEQLRDEQAENLKGFNGAYRDGYRDALDVILLSMETRKEGIEKCKEKKEKGL